MLRWDFEHVQDDVNPHILRLPVGTFPLSPNLCDGVHDVSITFESQVSNCIILQASGRY